MGPQKNHLALTPDQYARYEVVVAVRAGGQSCRTEQPYNCL